MKLRIVIVVTFALLVILFEVPKIKPAFEYAIGTEHRYGAYYDTNEFGTLGYKVGAIRTYRTPSTIKYGLQTPPSPRGWVLIHIITATINLALALILFIKPTKYDLHVGFILSYIVFGFTVLLQIDKLANLSMTSATIANAILLIGLGYSGGMQRYDIYLAIMSIPVMLSTFASLTI